VASRRTKACLWSVDSHVQVSGVIDVAKTVCGLEDVDNYFWRLNHQSFALRVASLNQGFFPFLSEQKKWRRREADFGIRKSRFILVFTVLNQLHEFLRLCEKVQNQTQNRTNQT
jgi:hypothetical protein